jgi:hypothetical protein
VLPFEARERASLPWWRQSLPAWAQLAAAALIFVSGLAIGASRAGASAPVPSESSPAVKASLAAINQRLATVEQLSQATSVSTDPTIEDAIMLKVDRKISASEERSRQERQEELAVQIFQLVDTQKRQVQRIDNSVAKVRNEFGTALQQIAYQR